ncbi:MAG: hypothetical protein PHN79_06750 [Methanoregula sp.]|jgi:hypothetical protein|nr:hypothetical protein [Methanoregula sp.]
MTFQWKDYLAIANYLYDYGQKTPSLNEAANRCVVSRSYYAAHCHLRNYAISHGAHFSTSGKAHGEVIDYFAKNPDPDMRKIGQKLIQLIKWRINSDYKDHISVNDLNAKNSITFSNDIFRLLP